MREIKRELLYSPITPTLKGEITLIIERNHCKPHKYSEPKEGNAKEIVIFTYNPDPKGRNVSNPKRECLQIARLPRP